MTHNLLDTADLGDHERMIENHRDASPEALIETADGLRERYLYRAAIALYRFALSQGESARLQFALGECLGKTYRYKEALVHVGRAFELEADRSEGRGYYAYLLERNQQMAQALEQYQQALLAGGKTDPWTFSHYGCFLEKCGETRAARQVYEELLTRHPTYSWALKRYALLLLHDGQGDRADQLIKNAVSEQQNNPFVKLNHLEYLILRDQGDLYEARYAALGYERLSLPFQVVVDLFDYFWRYLLPGKEDLLALEAYARKTAALPGSIHRDFDDLGARLQAAGGDQDEWQRLIELLIK